MEPKIMEEKKRSCNFRPNEEMLLVQLIEKYQDIVENKKTDTISNNEKAECWRAIEEEFNYASKSVYRTVKILKKKYENIKKNVRKKLTNDKTNGMEIDGDPLDTTTPLNEVEQKVKAILDSRSGGFVTTFDGDSENSCQKIEEFVPIKQEPDEGEPHIVHDDDDDDDDQNNHQSNETEQHTNPTIEPGCSKWNRHNRPQRLWQRRSKHFLGCKPDRCFSGELINWLKSKASYEQLKREHLILKYNLLKEKHNLEMQMLREEHKLKMEILKINKNKLILSDKCDL